MRDKYVNGQIFAEYFITVLFPIIEYSGAWFYVLLITEDYFCIAVNL